MVDFGSTEYPNIDIDMNLGDRINSLPTVDFYNRWSEIYEKDSDPLIILDDLQLKTFLPEFLALLIHPRDQSPLKIIDFGCGTGRNTVKLLPVQRSQITGLDASEKMLDVARKRCRISYESLAPNARTQSFVLERFDLLHDATISQPIKEVHGIISTLVLEHLPLSAFFSFAASHLIRGGHLLVTNVHPDKKSLANFIDSRTSQRIYTHSSLVHEIDDIIEEAKRYGFAVVGGVREAALDVDLVKQLGKKPEKWIGVNFWVGMIFVKQL